MLSRVILLGCLLYLGSLAWSSPVIERLKTGFQFTEGPAIGHDGSIYFTDIPASVIYKLESDGSCQVFRENSGHANGLAFDAEGSLYACEQGRHRITVTREGGLMVELVSHFEDKRLNSPNDLYLSPHGGIYFTDPRYGNRDSMELDHESVYYLSSDGELSLVADDLVRPNGIVGTPDGKWLYVADHGAKQTYRYHVQSDGSLTGRTLFANQGSDGMAMDSAGNLFLTDIGVSVYSQAGELIDTIALPERPSNVALMSENPTVLFVTARTSVYRITLQ